MKDRPEFISEKLSEFFKEYDQIQKKFFFQVDKISDDMTN